MIGRCCGQEWDEAHASIAQEGPHRVARCPECNAYLKALPGPSAAFLMPFGKYKGSLVADLWQQDAPYCAWLAEQPWLKPRLKQVLEDTRP